MNTSILRHAISGMVGALFCALINSTVNAIDAPLSPGNPVTIGTPSIFPGVGGTNNSGGAFTALSAFEAAIGGPNNGANPPPQPNGFRAINWDGVQLDGTDFGGITIVIDPNHVVGIPLNRFQERGVFFDEIYAVSGPASATDPSTFTTVNPTVTNLFPAFSSTKTFAMFNDNGIGFRFVLASVHTTSQEFAATRGFGAIFRNVALANTTSIEYFNGARSLGKFFVPFGTQGQAEFLGVLFANPIVTSVQITCGTDVLFSFDGTTFSSNSINNPPGGHNLVVTDDFVYAEPAVATNAQPAIAATAGSPFNGLVATFSDLDPNGNARNFTATIDWGDGHFSPGTIAANPSGGFNVNGANSYSAGGTLPVTVKIADLEGEALTIQNTAAVTGAGQLLNISTRGHVETNDNVLIGGFIIGSTSGTTRVILRGIGPSLTNAGVPGVLQDPTLELHDASGAMIGMNDNWKDTQQAEIQATGLAPTNDLESAIVASLAPGPYTIILRGKNNTVGVGLVEAYNLQ
jgi:hypothetical protein